MKGLTKEQVKSRQRTLLTAILLSMWAPLTTGWAVLLSHSTTQTADFIRRTVELFALLVSYLIFRHIVSQPHIEPSQQERLEKITAICVAGAMFCSGITMLILGISRLQTFTPGGNVYPGLAIAFLGILVNTGFWRRYARFNKENPQTVMGAQQTLYRAKAFIDLCVLLALTAVALDPYHPSTRYIDISGSFVVALYLLGSGIKTFCKTPKTIVPDQSTPE